jgi:two-component system sensor histidine kinase BaeS
VQRLSKILDDILTLSRLDSLPDPTLMPLDVNLLLSTLVQEFQPLAVCKNIHIASDLMPAAPSVLANRVNLHRALSKILENAVQYTPAGGSITVRTRQVSDTLVIEMVDTGIGIMQADLPLVFDYFFRGDKARSANEGSVGLGLSIARRIIELYHGKIEAESVAGEGSTFRVMLPINVASTRRFR